MVDFSSKKFLIISSDKSRIKRSSDKNPDATLQCRKKVSGQWQLNWEKCDLLLLLF